MARMPNVPFIASPNYSSPVVRPPYGVILHITEGSFQGAVGWESETRSQVSSYFVTRRDGYFVQCVDTDHKAWTQGGGNPYWIGIENEGFVENLNERFLTEPQMDAVAHIYAWCVQMWGIPIQSTDDPRNGRGLGWHGMGAGVWETPGHPSCPGEAIKSQRPAILAKVVEILNPVKPAPKLLGVADMIMAPPRQQHFADHAHPAYLELDIADKCIIAHNGATFKETAQMNDAGAKRRVYTLAGVPSGFSRAMNTDGTEALDTILVSIHGSDEPQHFHFA